MGEKPAATETVHTARMREAFEDLLETIRDAERAIPGLNVQFWRYTGAAPSTELEIRRNYHGGQRAVKKVTK